MSTEQPQDPEAIERALRAGLEDFDLDDAIAEAVDELWRAQCREVHPGQPDHWPP